MNELIETFDDCIERRNFDGARTAVDQMEAQGFTQLAIMALYRLTKARMTV